MERFLLFLLPCLVLICDCYQDVPKIISLTPQSVTILAENDAIFECKVVGFPAAQIYWMKDNRRLGNHNKKFDIKSGPNVSYLRVKDASRSWSRHLLNISCIAENYLGKDHLFALLTTLDYKPADFPSVVITNPKSVEPNTYFEIECNVSTASHPVTVLWYQSDQLINFASQKYQANWHQIDESRSRHVLKVDGIPLSTLKNSQEINFHCAASTADDSTQVAHTSILLRNRLMPPVILAPKREVIELEYGSSINLTCYGNGMPRPTVKWREVKPETPIDLKVTTIYFNSIELEWKPGGIQDVLHYNIKYREHRQSDLDTEIYSPQNDESNFETNHHMIDYDDDSALDSFVQVNTTQTRFKVDNILKPYTFYEFKVAAVNMLGKSDETNTIRVRTAATKPGRVENIRYTCLGDFAYLIRFDEPENTNGKLVSFRIYHTDQATNPISRWTSSYIPLNEIPYKLNLYKGVERVKRYFDAFSRYDQFHFIRVSAVNAELGEGPYSKIIELRNIEKKFDAPFNFEVHMASNRTEMIGTSTVSLEWSYDLDVLRQVHKELNIHQKNHYHKSRTSRLNDQTLSEEDQEMLKNVSFELYLIHKVSNSTSLQDISFRQLIRPFRTISALKILTQNKLKRSVIEEQIQNRMRQNIVEPINVQFELKNLQPNTKYVFQMTAKMYHLESHMSDMLKLQTLPEAFSNDKYVTEQKKNSKISKETKLLLS